MSPFDDSSPEMHDDPLTPEAADRLLDGDPVSPEFAGLTSLVAEVRTTVGSTPTPAVRGPLAEYVGVQLGTHDEPVGTPASAGAVIDLDRGTPAAEPRRTSMVAGLAAIIGTVGGKVALAGAVTVASVGGAHASGMVDVPGLPDVDQSTIIETDVAESAPLPLIDEEEKPSDEQTEDAADAAEEEPKPTATIPFDESDELWDHVKPEDREPEPVEPKDEEPTEPDEEPKAEEPIEEPKQEEPKVEEPAEPTIEQQIGALEEQLYRDKEAVYGAAADAIAPLDLERKGILQELEPVLADIDAQWWPLIEDLKAAIEVEEDPAELERLHQEKGEAYGQWEAERNAAAASHSPRLGEIEQELTQIELARDAEIERLLAEFHAAVEALRG